LRRRTPRARILLLGSLGALAALLLVPAASTKGPAQASYIVVLNPGVDASAFAGRLGATAERTYSAALDGFVAALSPGQLKKVESDPVVQTVVPDDESFSFADQTVPTGVARVGWASSPTAQSSPVDADIAIIDSGIDSDHPDLDVQEGSDCGGTGSTEDFIGHGTAVAGLAAAIDNGVGIVGVAPGARLWPVSIEDGKGKVSESAVICALDWVTENAPENAGVIDVANMSVGRNGHDSANCGRNPQGRIRDPLHAAVCAAVDAGVTLVVSAGNGSTEASKQVPAAYDEVITVSAMADSDGEPGGNGPPCSGEEDDTFASFSNYGADVDIAAPGVCLESTTNDGGYGVFDGTSFSAPLVAGAAALYATAHPTASPADIKDAILDNREQVSLQGDPDGIDEGVLNVAGF
jgi:subtilisin